MATFVSIWLEALYAIAINFVWKAGPHFLDLNLQYVTVIIPSSHYNDDGELKEVFEVNLSEPEKIKNSVYLFDRGGKTTAQFLSEINSMPNASENSLVEYEGLVAIDFRDLKASKNIVINETRIHKKNYDPVANRTHLHVFMDNEIDYKIFTVAGDVTDSGGTYYGYYGGYGN